ncbi:MAG: LpqB family beta-propeller domain-containing protein [Actinomycetota bacterium]
MRAMGIVLVVTSLGLAGCSSVGHIGITKALSAQVPTSGPVEQGNQVASTDTNQFIRVIASPPTPGMTQLQVVQGFLESSASFDGNHAVARQYLTPQASQDWNPGLGVRVYEGNPALAESGSTVRMVGSEVGRIAADGRYEVAAAGSEMRVRFGLSRVNGEWRIAAAPDGLLLSQVDVDRAFRSHSLYFFNPGFTTLVPDVRMVPVIGPGLATTLVRRLIDGPNPWLQPAVRTGFPAGVDLNIEAVPVEGGVARIDLTASALSADGPARVALSQQLVWTLRQVPEVQSVSITAAGQLFIVPGIANPQPRDAWSQVDPNAMPAGSRGYVATSVGVRALLSQGTIPVPGASGRDAPVIGDIAVSADSSQVAGFDIDGILYTARLAPDAQLVQRGEYPGATSLAFDSASVLWLVDSENSLVLIGNEARAIAIEGLPRNARLLAAVPSRDSTRVALVVREPQRTSLYLARIVRTGVAAGAPVSIEAPIRVESRLAEAVDVAWSTADSLAVLGSESAGALLVFDVSLGRGAVTPRGAPEAPVSLAAAPGFPTLVAAADGVVYDNAGAGWQGRANAASPAYPN